mmetsp:Transcript_17371/g.55595  ORF Transcript_17371/g.55595 Transcript_17371/m.55595 type:complete len:334 (+) Transcript_17371:525-1526(+)
MPASRVRPAASPNAPSALNSKRPAWSWPAVAAQSRFAASTASAVRWPALRPPRRPPPWSAPAAGCSQPPRSPATRGSRSTRARSSSRKRSRRNSRKESPYWGVRCTASSRHLRARPRWKCEPVGFMNTRAPSHQTSPLLGTSRTALRKVAIAAPAPPSPLCSSAMRADQRRPVAGWRSRALVAVSLAARRQPWRASMKMCSRKTFQSWPSQACASSRAARASSRPPRNSSVRARSMQTATCTREGASARACARNLRLASTEPSPSSDLAASSQTFQRRCLGQHRAARPMLRRHSARLPRRPKAAATSKWTFQWSSWQTFSRAMAAYSFTALAP